MFYFNDSHNRLYLIKDHLDNKKKCLMQWLFFPTGSKGSFICTFPDRTEYTMAFNTKVAEQWLEPDYSLCSMRHGLLGPP